MTAERRAGKPRRWWPVAVGVGVAAFAALGFGRFLVPDKTAVLPDGAWFRVVSGPLTINIVESGSVNPREREIIKCELEGRTTILYLIAEGTLVTKGELLVELDASALTDQKVEQDIRVQNAEAAFIQARENLEVVKILARSDIDAAVLTLRFAREDLDQYQAGLFPNALKETEARITLANEDLQRASEKLEWSKVLYAEKYISGSEKRADELAVKKAELDVALAEDNLKLLKEFTYKRKMAELESGLSQAELALERIKRRSSADTIQADAALRARQSEFDRQTEKLVKLNVQIAKARIVAPREGLVVYATSAQMNWRGNAEPLAAGQEVRERQELIHLPTASTFLAEVKAHESNLERIAVGMPVQVTVDALPGRVFGGSIANIAPLPDPMSMFMNPDLKLYTMQVHIEGGGDALRTGMSCKADIRVAHYEDAVQVPVQSVVRLGGLPTVYVRHGDAPVPRAVEIGLDNNRMVHILDGIAPGDEVLLAPPFTEAVSKKKRPTRNATAPERPEAPMKREASDAPPAASPAAGTVSDGAGASSTPSPEASGIVVAGDAARVASGGPDAAPESSPEGVRRTRSRAESDRARSMRRATGSAIP